MIHAPVRCAQSSSSSRRAIDMTVPVGNWCDGVTYAARACGQRAMPADTFSPAVSTGTGTIVAPSARTASRVAG